MNQIAYGFALFLQGIVFATFAVASLTPRWRASISFFLYILAHTVAIVLSMTVQFSFTVGMLMEIALFGFQVFVLFKDSFAKKLIFTCQLIITTFLIDIFISSVHIAIAGISVEESRNLYPARTYGVLIGLFLFIVCFVGIYSFTHRKKDLFKNTTLRRFILFPIGQAFLIYCVELTALEGVGTVIIIATLIGTFFCIISDIIILRTMQSFEKNARLEKQVQMMEYTQQMQLTNYKNIQERELELAKLQHDYKNHLSAVAALVESEEKDSNKAALQLLESIQKRYSENWLVTYCENRIINAVLTCKKEECAQDNIEFQMSVNLPSELPMENVHLCSVFSNLLDNAIRAVKPLPQEKRKINLKANMHEKTLFVNVENLYEKELVQKGTGYGLQILNDIATQYHGQIEAKGENGIFTAGIILEL